MLKHAFTLALLFAFAGPAGLAHAGTMGGISGTITDAKTGAPIPGVHLQITSPAHALTLEKDGYYTRYVSGYSVSADQTQQYDLTLTPAAGASPGS